MRSYASRRDPDIDMETSEEEDELESVLQEIHDREESSELFHGDDENDDDEEQDDDELDQYDRTAVIILPRQISEATGIHSVTVPVRKIMKMMLSEFPMHKSFLGALIDEYYAGDHEDDYDCDFDDQCHYDRSASHMEDALERVRRKKGKKAREAKSAELESFNSRVKAQGAANLEDCKSEYARCNEKDEIRQLLTKAYSDGWERFAVDRQTWGTDAAQREDTAKRELDAIYEKLKVATHEMWAVRKEIELKTGPAWEAFHKRERARSSPQA